MAAGLFDVGNRTTVQIPADFTEHGIIVRATVGGRGLDLEVDSGATDSVIDADVARQLGLRLSHLRRGTFSGDFEYASTEIPELHLGDLTALHVAMIATPFSHMLGDRRVVGLLGANFFSGARVEVNFSKQILSIGTPSISAPAGKWTAMPIEIIDRLPTVSAKFNGIAGSFIVDLGADKTALFPHYFAKFHPNKPGEVIGKVMGVAGKAYGYREYIFGRFDLGALAFADAPVTVAEGTGFESKTYDGLLGRNILSQFNLIFDYPHHELYVQSMVQ